MPKQDDIRLSLPLKTYAINFHWNVFSADFWSKFCLLYWMVPCWQAVWRKIFNIRIIFGVRFERRKVDKKSKPTRKLKLANSILQYFEYLSQILSKSILVILSYIVSWLVHFFETQCTCLAPLWVFYPSNPHHYISIYLQLCLPYFIKSLLITDEANVDRLFVLIQSCLWFLLLFWIQTGSPRATYCFILQCYAL